MQPENAAMVRRLEARYPAWHVWIIWRAVGGALWCAQPWDESSPAVNTEIPEAGPPVPEHSIRRRVMPHQPVSHR
jgi:hypothetical protein